MPSPPSARDVAKAKHLRYTLLIPVPVIAERFHVKPNTIKRWTDDELRKRQNATILKSKKRRKSEHRQSYKKPLTGWEPRHVRWFCECEGEAIYLPDEDGDKRCMMCGRYEPETALQLDNK